MPNNIIKWYKCTQRAYSKLSVRMKAVHGIIVRIEIGSGVDASVMDVNQYKALKEIPDMGTYTYNISSFRWIVSIWTLQLSRYEEIKVLRDLSEAKG